MEGFVGFIPERVNHARDMMLDLPLNKFDGIIIVSGDGLVYEVSILKPA